MARLFSSLRLALITAITLFYPAVCLGEREVAKKAHGEEVLREIKNLTDIVHENHLIVVSYIAGSESVINSLESFKEKAEGDIQDLKKKSSSCGLP